ncbi:MAG: hypothetical protein NWT02_03675 [Opitutales bacterium]|nr:hypothetical protein [Opitutales bacterium]MDP4644792.1 hypothetical protein [Opitutales bacterium]MDP4883854.1 hypothetical protein [Opitutales bacterium]
MKHISKILVFLVASVALLTPSFAGSEAGKDSARYYKSHPEEFDTKRVDVDCIFVTRINGGPQVEGVSFYLAHTKDDDNNMRGGSIVVAVLTEEASSFVKKYGSMPDIDRGSSERVDSKRLRGTFHLLEHGHVYIDESEGPAHDLILEHLEAAKGLIWKGDNTSGTPNRKR